MNGHQVASLECELYLSYVRETDMLQTLQTAEWGKTELIKPIFFSLLLTEIIEVQGYFFFPLSSASIPKLKHLGDFFLLIAVLEITENRGFLLTLKDIDKEISKLRTLVKYTQGWVRNNRFTSIVWSARDLHQISLLII